MRPADVPHRGDEDIRRDTGTRPPAHYGSLNAVEREALAMLSRGVADRRSALHTPVFVTSGLDGVPAARTVVLRGFEPAPPIISIHTDYRSAKVAELGANKRAAAVFYDAKSKIQIRAVGPCAVHHHDDIAHAAWQRVTVSSRRCYLGAAPGTASDHPTSGLPEPLETASPSFQHSERGYAHFAILRLRVCTLDWLYLSARGHRRARLTWSERGDDRTATWLTP